MRYAGFNTGFNVAESTNFAFADWIPTGAKCLRRYRSPPTRDTTLLHEALVCTAVQHAQVHELPALLDELRAMLASERDARETLRKAGVIVPADEATSPDGELASAGAIEQTWEDGSDDAAHFFSWRCRVCRHLCYFSVVKCGCANECFLCPEHGTNTYDDDEMHDKPASYIHLDEDPEAARAVAAAKSHGRPQGRSMGGGAPWFAKLQFWASNA